MRATQFLVGFMTVALIAGCTTKEDLEPAVEHLPEIEEGTAQQEAQPEEEPEELAKVDNWRFEIEVGEGFELVAYDGGTELARRAGHEEGGRLPEAGEHFTTEFCGLHAVIVQLTTSVSTAISSGTFYTYVLVDRQDPQIGQVFTASDVRDREDGSVIKNDWEELESQLRAGVEEGDELCTGGTESVWMN